MSLINDQLNYNTGGLLKPSGSLIDILQTVIFALAISIFVYLFLAIPNQVQGLSMYPTLDDSEILLTNKFIQISGGEGRIFSDYNYQRGDMVVFQQPGRADLVKRIIGLPGERIMLREGSVIIDDQVLIEEYLPAGVRTNSGEFLPEGVEKLIPQSHYVVMGDNRSNSKDSRFQDVGFVAREHIKGSPFLRVSPLDKFGLLARGEYRTNAVEQVFGD